MDDKLTTKDAITVLRNLQDWLYYSSMNGGTSIQREAIDMAIGVLKQPEIIRCKDCKHYEYGICKKAGLCVNKSPNGFCDWGER